MSCKSLYPQSLNMLTYWGSPLFPLLLMEGLHLGLCYMSQMGFPGGSVVKNLSAVQEMQEIGVHSLGGEGSLEKGMAPPSNILAWKIPWTEKPGGLQSIGCQESDTTEATEHAYVIDGLVSLPPQPTTTTFICRSLATWSPHTHTHTHLQWLVFRRPTGLSSNFLQHWGSSQPSHNLTSLSPLPLTSQSS